MGERSRKFYKSLYTSFRLEWILFALVFLISHEIFMNELEDLTPLAVDQQKQIQSEGKLLDSTGSLLEYGYSKQPLKELNEEDLRIFLLLKQLSFLRYKKWDSFDAQNDEGQIQINIIDCGYFTYIQIVAIVFEGYQKIQVEDITYNHFYSNEQVLDSLPKSSMFFEGSYKYSSEELQLQIVYDQNTEDKKLHIVTVTFESNSFVGSLVFQKDLSSEEFVSVKPISKDQMNFFYNTKTPALTVKGDVYLKDSLSQPFTFNEKNSNGARNVLRGVFNYLTNWFTASAQGKIQSPDGKDINFGIYLGNQNRNDSLKLKDRVHINGKIENINILKEREEKENSNLSWILTTEVQGIPGSFKAQFHPLITSEIKYDKILIKLEIKEYFGYFSGQYITQEGEKILFDRLYGYFQTNASRW